MNTQLRYRVSVWLILGIALAAFGAVLSASAAVPPTPEGAAARAVPVGKHPKGVAATADRVYVALYDEPKVVVLDTKTDTVIAKWSTGAPSGPRYGNGVAVCGNKLLIANRDSGTVSILDRKTGAFHKLLKTGTQPFGIAASQMSDKTRRAFVAGYGNDKVFVIDCDAETIVARPAGGDEPSLVSSLDGRGYVTYYAGGNTGGVRVFDKAGNLLRDITTGKGAFGVATNNVEGVRYFWVGNRTDKQLVIINLDTYEILSSPYLMFTPNALVSPPLKPGTVGPGRTHVWTVDTLSNRALCLDGETGAALWAVPVGRQSTAEGGQGIAIAPLTDAKTGARDYKVYVTNYAADSVSSFLERCAGLQIRKGDETNPVNVDDKFVYWLVAQNRGLEPLHNVVVEDALDPSLVFKGAVPGVGPLCPITFVAGNPNLVWEVGNLAPLESQVCRFTVQVLDTTDAVLVNRAQMTGLDPHDRPLSGTTVENTFVNQQEPMIGDKVWDDLDNDGIQDAGEPGIEGVKVELLENRQVVDTIFTDEDGIYKFQVKPGDYQLRFYKPAGYNPSTQDVPPDDTRDSDANANGETIEFALKANRTMLKWDAGFVKKELTGVTCTYTATPNKILMQLRVNDEKMQNKIYDLELLKKWQIPAWTFVEGVFEPVAWQHQAIDKGTRVFTFNNPLKRNLTYVYSFRYTAPAVPDTILLHASDAYSVNMGSLRCTRLTKVELDGISCTFETSGDELDMRIKIQEAAHSNKFYRLELPYIWQTPEWTDGLGLLLPEAWSSTEIPGQLTLSTLNKPLLEGETYTFRLWYQAPSEPESMRLHAVSQYGENLGNFNCQKACPYPPCPYP